MGQPPHLPSRRCPLQAGTYLRSIPSGLGLDGVDGPWALDSPASEADADGGLAGGSAASSPARAWLAPAGHHGGIPATASVPGLRAPAGASAPAAARFSSYPDVNAAISGIAALGRGGGVESFSHGASGALAGWGWVLALAACGVHCWAVPALADVCSSPAAQLSLLIHHAPSPLPTPKPTPSAPPAPCPLHPRHAHSTHATPTPPTPRPHPHPHPAGWPSRQPHMSKMESLASSTVRAAVKVEAGMIVVLTHNCRSAALLAKYRPPMPVLVLVVPKLRSDGLHWRLEGRIYARQCLLIRWATHAGGRRRRAGGRWGRARRAAARAAAVAAAGEAGSTPGLEAACCALAHWLLTTLP